MNASTCPRSVDTLVHTIVSDVRLVLDNDETLCDLGLTFDQVDDLAGVIGQALRAKLARMLKGGASCPRP